MVRYLCRWAPAHQTVSKEDTMQISVTMSMEEYDELVESAASLAAAEDEIRALKRAMNEAYFDAV